MSVFDSNAAAGVSQSASSTVASALSAKSKSAVASAKDTSGTSGTNSSSSTSSDPSQITSSDFLTLLVSELQNQDPTQPTDPNSYIQQLVGVNSLQQLIQINQEVGSIAPASTTTSTSAS
ncbi:hypothetical protein GCM10011507_04610 [Edaphobacter acidisoli]|uniref:Basal-body rod modification protein FlgD n=1 Tax=Edaphobacter acidisoli TaxID=2040573 RepID=A0A916RHM2_9BACT|nr:flagellar hook capping FlgD N-terminal domain-containing protein [Edaphobacter acidisoli]GGA56379.1 hypothetical protein GCM10011507_04610 [Edaphobacter acidisoli]